MNIVQFNFHLHAWFAAILSVDTGIERVFHPHVYSYAVLNINCTSWGKRKCSPALPTIGYCWLKHFFPTATIKMKPLRAKIGTKFTRQWPWAIFIALRLAGPSKWLKQIIQIKHNMVKNPIWSEVNQLAIYKCSRIWTGDYREQIQLAVRAGLNSGPPDCTSSALITRPRCLWPKTTNSSSLQWTQTWTLQTLHLKDCVGATSTRSQPVHEFGQFFPIGLNMYLGNLTCLSWHQTRLCGDHLDFSNKLEKMCQFFKKCGYRPRRSALFSAER